MYLQEKSYTSAIEDDWDDTVTDDVPVRANERNNSDIGICDWDDSIEDDDKDDSVLVVTSYNTSVLDSDWDDTIDDIDPEYDTNVGSRRNTRTNGWTYEKDHDSFNMKGYENPKELESMRRGERRNGTMSRPSVASRIKGSVRQPSASRMKVLLEDDEYAPVRVTIKNGSQDRVVHIV